MTTINAQDELDRIVAVPLKALKVAYWCGEDDDIFDFDTNEEVPRDDVPLLIDCTQSDTEGVEGGNEDERDSDDEEEDDALHAGNDYKNDFVCWLFQLSKGGFSLETSETAVLLFHRLFNHFEGRLALHDHKDYVAAAVACLIEASKRTAEHTYPGKANIVAYYQSYYPQSLHRLDDMTTLLKNCQCAASFPRAVDFVPILMALIPFEMLPETVRDNVFEIAMDQCEVALERENYDDPFASLARPSMVAFCAIVNAAEPFFVPVINGHDDNNNNNNNSNNNSSIMGFLMRAMGMGACDALVFSLMDSLAKPIRDIHAAADAEFVAVEATKRNVVAFTDHDDDDKSTAGYALDNEYAQISKKRRFSKQKI